MLTRGEASDAVARYEESFGSFERIVDEMLSILRSALELLGVKHVLAGRAKSPTSLRGKLIRGDSTLVAADVAGAPLTWTKLGDLAAARVMVYDERGFKDACAAVAGAFMVEPVKKEKTFEGVRGYRARHFAITLKGAEGYSFRREPTAQELDAVCEVQVCMLTDHVWNELEHDIKYKQPDGNPDASQVELLVSLRRELDLVGDTIARLIARTDQRRAKNDQAIQSGNDLRRYLEGRDECTLHEDFSDLFELLRPRVAEFNPKWLDNHLREAPLDRARADELASKHDPHGAFGKVAAYAVRLAHGISKDEVANRLDEAKRSVPLWKFLLSVLDDLMR